MVMNEKRKAVRVVKRIEVKFNSAAENTAITSDLSENGMFIATCRGKDPGSIIDIKLQLPDAKALFINGKVIRNTKTPQPSQDAAQKGMGVELISPPSDYVMFVQRLLD